jgi:hypothetical protein
VIRSRLQTFNGIEDIVGLYVDPPEKALVLSVDEKSPHAAGFALEKGPCRHDDP